MIGLLSVLLALAASSARAESVVFVDDSMNPVYSMDADTHQVTFVAYAPGGRTEAVFDAFQQLGEDDPLPADFAFMAREAAVRYAALDLDPPATWTPRYVREVFLSSRDLVSFIDRHFSQR